jgi:hypothetical protein
MPRKKLFKRRPPSDSRALRGATDPGIVRLVVIGVGLLAAVAIGVALVIRGLL